MGFELGAEALAELFADAAVAEGASAAAGATALTGAAEAAGAGALTGGALGAAEAAGAGALGAAGTAALPGFAVPASEGALGALSADAALAGFAAPASEGVLGALGTGAALPGFAVPASEGALGALSADAALAGFTGATGGASFLPVTGFGPGVSSLAPDLAGSFGVAGVADQGIGYAGLDATGASSLGGETIAGGSSFLDAAGVPEWLKAALKKTGTTIGKDPLRALGLGLGLTSMLRQPKLPGAAQTALGSSTQAVQQAQATIASGGTSSPAWPQLKASIDQQIDQQLKDAVAQMQQSSANSGMGGPSSGVVQQQQYALTQRAEAQRQALYSQALQQIVSEATTMLTGGNQTLGAVANMQLSQSQQAMQAAQQIAYWSALLSKQSTPGG